MRRILIALGALLALGALTLGCSSGSTTSSTTGTTAPSHDPALPVWVRGYCDAVEWLFGRGMRSSPPTPGTDTRQLVIDDIHATVTSIRGAIAELEALGPPPVPDGPAVHDAMVAGFGEMATMFQQAEAAIRAMPPDTDPAALTAQIRSQVEPIFADSQNPFRDFEARFPEATALLEATQDEECRTSVGGGTT